MKRIILALLTFTLIVSCGRKVSPEECEDVAIQRLKDIRTLQLAYKNVYGYFASTIEELQLFYNEGEIKVLLQVGSRDDSEMAAHTAVVTSQLLADGVAPADIPEALYELYTGGDTNLCFTVESGTPVKDSLFTDRTDFSIDDLPYIPYSDGDMIQMQSLVLQVSGVNVPLFEATIPYESLFKGLKKKYIDDCVNSRIEAGLYPGLKVGDLERPNNCAGNWE